MPPTRRLFLAMVSTPDIVFVTPPLGLLYIASYLRERFSLDIRVADQRVEGWSPQRLAQEIIDFDPHIVGLGCLTPSSYMLPEIIRTLRAAIPEAFIALGGPHISAVGAGALETTEADVAVVGEGEKTMEQVVRACIEGEEMKEIPGLIRREADGSVVVNPGFMPLIEDLDSLPMPAYDLIDLTKYWKMDSIGVLPPPRKYVSLFSSRGCPYGCMYCHNVFGKRFRTHSVERIIDEIKYMTEKFGADEVEFLDDCFNLDKKRLFAYSEKLCGTTGPLKTSFPNALRADLLDREAVDALVNAGMYYTALALESGTARIQELIKKRLDIPKFLNGAALCAENRVFTRGFVMLGFPTETESEIKETIRVAAESQMHTASFFRVTPFINTPLYHYVKTHSPEKLINIDYNGMEYRRVASNLSDVSDRKLKRYVSTASLVFHMRPGRIYRILRDYPRRSRLPYYGIVFFKRSIFG